MSVNSAVSQRTATASGTYVVARTGAKALDFISLMVLARLLTPGDFGLIAIAMVFIQVVEAIFEVPVGAILMRARPITRASLDTGFTLSSIRGLVVFGVLAGAAFGIAHLYSDPRLKWLVMALAGAFICKHPSCSLRAPVGSQAAVLAGSRRQGRLAHSLGSGGGHDQKLLGNRSCNLDLAHRQQCWLIFLRAICPTLSLERMAYLLRLHWLDHA